MDQSKNVNLKLELSTEYGRMINMLSQRVSSTTLIQRLRDSFEEYDMAVNVVRDCIIDNIKRLEKSQSDTANADIEVERRNLAELDRIVQSFQDDK